MSQPSIDNKIVYKTGGFWRYNEPLCEHGENCERFPCWKPSKIMREGDHHYYEHDPNKEFIKDLEYSRWKD